MNVQTSIAVLFFAAVVAVPAQLPAQAPAPAATGASQAGPPRQSGTIKAVTPQDFVLTNAAGQDIAVNVPSTVRILLVDPATHDIKTAQPGTVADIAGGDKAIVTGTAGDTGQTMTATRIYLLKSGAIAAMHAQEQAAWAHSIGGLVRSVDAATGVITVANGARTYTVTTSPSTVVRRYAGGSVQFQDAVKSDVSVIRPGDQLQARGQRPADGTTMAADEIVTGSFSNFSGLLTAVDPGAGTVTLKDLATKKVVTVAITGRSNLRNLPAGFGQGVSGRPNGAGAGASPDRAATGRPAAAGQGGAGGRPNASHLDLARLVNRLPQETVAELKPGEAVMIVASNQEGKGLPTAVTLVSGVEQILAASPNGETTLSPWSLGSGQGEGEAGEGGGGGASGPGGR